MNSKYYIFFGISLISVLFVPNVIAEEAAIPGWVKNNAGWWAEDQIDENSFLTGIQYLIDHSVLDIPTNQKLSDGGLLQLEKYVYQLPKDHKTNMIKSFGKCTLT